MSTGPPALSFPRFLVVADLLQNETVTSLVHKRKDKPGEDSGLESGHTSMNTASDTQSDSHSGAGSGAEDSLHSPAPASSSRTPDLVRTSQHPAHPGPPRHNSDFGERLISGCHNIQVLLKYLKIDTFNMKTYQRRQQSRYTNLPVTIV